ncbi:multidrug DMT transporter permease [Cupriavidus gilardii CR3]|uniref:DMT family transporter n=1 Tax=Cupriavidus gilardii TaxID=82541 RepID=A0A849BAR9_9BURK|nr:DMT family transporter [Cupriavidus gilardii]ALD91676.1 multidrug DMT transporter permease [Cupriavidus gilardii CR3]KAB0595443.1 DMT family transporter [Cupriavidus gilardii]MCT9016207.1 DMT family transporter [Cupriavidus gilardii]MCT9055977.1 DMT family transporter [Cupriavidus gilardii]NNH11506.1 DMT family transporter [Cupriavidus gilardii]
MSTRPSAALVVGCTALSMLAFAGNSLLCRLALRDTTIDAASFTTVRLLSGAITLWVLVQLRGGASRAPEATPTTEASSGNWRSALALFAYAILFSYAYAQLSAATGALLLFGAVQVTMIGRGLWLGERPHLVQTAGYLIAVAGLIGMLLPGLSAPPLLGALLMIASGAAWGIYSIRAKGARDPVRANAGNFLRASVCCLPIYLAALPWASHDAAGMLYAVLSGAIASALGYAIWYVALRGLTVTTAGLVQLSVPVIAAAGGVLLLGEAVTWRLVVASIAVLGGVGLAIAYRRSEPPR